MKLNKLKISILKTISIDQSPTFEFKNLVFENVSYSYSLPNKMKDHVLKNVNLEINKGDKVAIRGETGSGKNYFNKFDNWITKK